MTLSDTRLLLCGNISQVGCSENLPIFFAYGLYHWPGCHVAWVTQLVVNKNFRRRYIATLLLQNLKFHPLFAVITAIGLASSHPASVNALAKFSRKYRALSDTYILRILIKLKDLSPQRLDLPFIAQNAKDILQTSPIQYIRDASSSLKGSIFEENPTPGIVSSAFTDFFVDHEEPLNILQTYIDAGRWCLGDLLDGHEFLIIVPVASA